MIDIVLCASGADEVSIVSAIARELGSQARVVKRCADLTELLASTSSGFGDVAVIDVDLAGLDRGQVFDIASRPMAVVGLTSAHSRRDPQDLGLTYVIGAYDDPEQMYKTLATAVLHADDAGESVWVNDSAEGEQASAPCLAVWGPTGGPGRTFIASNLAWESSLSGCATLVVDADTFGPSLSQVFGVVESSSGVIAATRAAMKGQLSEQQLAGLGMEITDSLTLLTGIGVPSRFPELNASALGSVFEMGRRMHDVVIADCSSSLEDIDDPYASASAQSHVTVETLGHATHVLAVINADPLSLTRFIREAERLRSVTTAPVSVVVNRMDSLARLSSIEKSLRARVEVGDIFAVPYAPQVAKKAAWDGKMLAESAPKSDVRRAIEALATEWLAKTVRVPVSGATA